jgi:hypothetical protein
LTFSFGNPPTGEDDEGTQRAFWEQQEEGLTHPYNPPLKAKRLYQQQWYSLFLCLSNGTKPQ